ncbi:MAG: PAS domain S-box protein [Blastocatellia bacterium]|nr:PAS domain S-box protein [Blastocatellia bacterium]MBN8723402.1 PAS domain S-box protein [Acidobacteriota bacterium]
MRNRLTWLIASRLTVILILLGTAAIINIVSPSVLIVKVFVKATLVVSLLSIIYSFLVKFSSRYTLQAYIQIFTDIALVSWVVYETSLTEKSFAALYLVIVLAASTVLPRLAVLITSVLCVISYITVTSILYYQIFNSNLPSLSPDQSVPLYILAILVIGILGGQIAERLQLSHLALTQATQNLANLQAFNERIIESIHSGLVTTDITGNILSFNRAAEEITQHKANQVIKRTFFEVFGDLSNYLNFTPELLNTSKPIRFTSSCLSATGRQMYLGITASPLSGEDGKPNGLVFSFQDLTEIIKLEQEIRRRDRLAAMGKMAAGIAHEIRNPLAAMRGSIQVLRSELDLSEDQAQLMQIVLRESDRLDKIVSDFLAYARPSPAKLAEFDLVNWIKETVALIRYSNESSAKHEILVECPETSISIVADSNQLRQIIWNLARNSLQAMPEGGKLIIELNQNKEKDIILTFTDTGVGMSEEEMERIFEPFNSNRPGGTGLGMAIVYQIISDHNGKIDVVSHPNQGAKITITLPQNITNKIPIDLLPQQNIFSSSGKFNPNLD